MKLLVLDSVSAAGVTIARDLTKKLGHQALYASTTDEAFNQIETEKDRIGLVVFFLEEDPETGLAFVRDVRDYCTFAEIRCPKFLVLTPGNLPDGYRRNFRTFGAKCIVYGFLEELYASALEMISEAMCEKGKATIVVERMPHGTRFWVLGPAGREPFAVGPRQLTLLNYYAINFGTELSTADLAEVADTAISYVKVYIDRLRERFNEAASGAGVQVSGNDVFATFRKDGGFVHVLRARVLFI